MEFILSIYLCVGCLGDALFCGQSVGLFNFCSLILLVAPAVSIVLFSFCRPFLSFVRKEGGCILLSYN